MSKTNSLQDWREFKEYLMKYANSIDESSLNGQKYLKGVITSLIIDIQTLEELARGSATIKVNQTAWDDYVKHIKRFTLTELYSITESYLRDIALTEKIEIKSRNQYLSSLIEALVNSLDLKTKESNKNLIRELSKAFKGHFIEFPSILSAVLQHLGLDKKEKTDWTNYFEILRNMRNAIHNNFRCTRSIKLESSRYSKEFNEGDSVQVFVEDLKEIIDGLNEFFLKVKR